MSCIGSATFTTVNAELQLPVAEFSKGLLACHSCWYSFNVARDEFLCKFITLTGSSLTISVENAAFVLVTFLFFDVCAHVLCSWFVF